MDKQYNSQQKAVIDGQTTQQPTESGQNDKQCSISLCIHCMYNMNITNKVMFQDNIGSQNTTQKTKDKCNGIWHKTLRQEVSL